MFGRRLCLKYKNLLKNRSSRTVANITTHYSIKSRTNDTRWNGINLDRQSDEVDVLIIGGGPAGLSTAIRLAQLAKEMSLNQRICVLEKASDFGQHILSGACLEPTALNELIPDWKSRNSPVTCKVTHDKMHFLTKTNSIQIPHPPWFPVNNQGNYVISLGKFCKWLSTIAEELGVELYSGVGGSEVLYDENGAVKGIGTADSGIHKNGSPKENFERGMALNAKVTVFAEGCRGSLTKDVMKKFNLEKDSCPQSYAIGLKEAENHIAGYVEHNVGWPMDNKTYGGSFIYHSDEDNTVSVLKTHPRIRKILEGGERIGYGARALNEGGLQAIPKLIFPGGCLVGCAAGFMNIVKVKGIHGAMKSGMLAAEAIANKIFLNNENLDKGVILHEYPKKLENSWLMKELRESRNVRPSFDSKFGLIGMLAYTGGVWGFLRGMEPKTIKWEKHDHQHLLPSNKCVPKNYPKPDNKLTFDLLSSVSLTNTNHDHDEPPHLTLYDDDIPQEINLKVYDGPETRYCPAGVYEYVTNKEDGSGQVLQINAQNCIHCKTCDIKDPSQNINWVVPQNGGGPGYSGM